MTVPAVRKGNPNKKRSFPNTAVAAAVIAILLVVGLFYGYLAGSGHSDNTIRDSSLLLLHLDAKPPPPPLPPHNSLNKSRKRPLILLKDFSGLKVLSKGDSIYEWGTWDEAPIVVESHKLLFFTTPKVGCTVFKQLFRRMYGFADWKVHNDVLPHQPGANGLNYLYHYSPREADAMLTDPSWTRAIFVREPKERLLSAYLDKALHHGGKYVKVHCCHVPQLKTLLHCDDDDRDRIRRGGQQAQQQASHQDDDDAQQQPLVSFPDFLQIVYPQCMDPHWKPQNQRMPEKYWRYITFVGHMDTIQTDTRRLLENLGDAWTTFGATGWETTTTKQPSAGGIADASIILGDSSEQKIMIFAGTVEHATAARKRLKDFYTATDLEVLAEKLHAVDYENPLFNLTKIRV